MTMQRVPRTMQPAELAAELEVIASYTVASHDRDVLAEAARRIAPATAALADVPPRLELVADVELGPDLGAACTCLCHRLADGLGYSHRTATVDGDAVAPCCATPGRHYPAPERDAALLAAADAMFG